MRNRKRKHGEDESYFAASPSKKRPKPARTRGRKGKKAERASNNSSDSDPDYEFIFKNRGRGTKFEQSSKTDSMLEGNRSSGRMNDLLEESTSDYSTDRQNGTKGKRKKPTNCFGDVRVNRTITNYRSNLQTPIKGIKALRFNETHLREIKRTPFWLMFDAIYRSEDDQLRRRCQKNEDDIRQIMLAFDDLSESFMIGGELIPLVNRDVQLIFGISGGSETIPLKVREYEMPPWILRCFGQEINNPDVHYVLYKKYIFEKLKEMLSSNDENSVRDVARLTHCYLMAAVLSPNQNASIAWHLTVYLEKFDEIGQYDWCTFIVDMLRNQIMSSKNLRAGGCTIMLPFWLCEHTRLVKPKNKGAFPRFLKWDLNDVHKKLSHVKLSKLEINKLVLKPTSIEKDKFRALLKFCELEGQRQRNNPKSEDEESHYDRADEARSLSGDEDDVELIAKLGACGDLKPVNEASFSNKDNHEDIFAEDDTQNLSDLETEEKSSNDDEQDLTSEIGKRIQRKCDREMKKLIRKHQQEIQELQEIWECRFAEKMKEQNLLKDAQLKEVRATLLSSINDDNAECPQPCTSVEQHVESENRENDVLPSTSSISAPAEPIVCEAPVENIVTTNSQNEAVDQSKNSGDDEEAVETIALQDCGDLLPQQVQKDQTGRSLGSAELQESDVPAVENHRTEVATLEPTATNSAPSLLTDELERLRIETAQLDKTLENMVSQLKTECEKEIEEDNSEIRKKYEVKHQETEAAFRLKRNELDKNLDKVLRSKILAEAFRFNCLPSEVPGTRQVVPSQNWHSPGPSGSQPACRPMQQPQSRPVPVATQRSVAAQLVHSAASGTTSNSTRPLVINVISPRVGIANNHCSMSPHLRPSSTSPSVSTTMDAPVSSPVGNQASGVAKEDDN